MILVRVQHFLDPAGCAFFTQWLEEAGAFLSNIDGFVSIRQLTKVEAPGETHLLLLFSDETKLRTWATSPEHDALVARLAPYRLSPWQSEVFEVDSLP